MTTRLSCALKRRSAFMRPSGSVRASVMDSKRSSPRRSAAQPRGDGLVRRQLLDASGWNVRADAQAHQVHPARIAHQPVEDVARAIFANLERDEFLRRGPAAVERFLDDQRFV